MIILLGIYSGLLKADIHTKTCPQNVDSSFIHNCQKVVATEISIGKQINDVVHPSIIFSDKKKLNYQTTKRSGRNCKCILLSGTSQSEEATYYNFQLDHILEKTKLWRLDRSLAERGRLLRRWNHSVGSYTSGPRSSHIRVNLRKAHHQEGAQMSTMS